MNVGTVRLLRAVGQKLPNGGGELPLHGRRLADPVEELAGLLAPEVV